VGALVLAEVGVDVTTGIVLDSENGFHIDY